MKGKFPNKDGAQSIIKKNVGLTVGKLESQHSRFKNKKKLRESVILSEILKRVDFIF